MRKLILITAMVLVSASAQAGERSLSLGGGQLLPAAASNAVTTAGKVADAPAAPAVEAPPKPLEAPKYVERAAPAAAPQPQTQPTVQQAPVQQANGEPQTVPDARPAGEQPATSHRSSHRHYARRWTEGRIIGELHRRGIYW